MKKAALRPAGSGGLIGRIWLSYFSVDDVVDVGALLFACAENIAEAVKAAAQPAYINCLPKLLMACSLALYYVYCLAGI
jgi:hypothetical protein